MSITISKSSIMQYNGSVHQVNVAFNYRGYLISLGLDDSCGNPDRLFRGDFVIFKDELDVTAEFFPEYEDEKLVPASSAVLKDIFLGIDKKLESSS